jgi:hypothetical protein
LQGAIIGDVQDGYIVSFFHTNKHFKGNYIYLKSKQIAPRIMKKIPIQAKLPNSR